MEEKAAEQPSEVTIQLTEEQQKQIKRATGRLIRELKIEAVEDRANPVRSFYIDETG